MSGRKLFFALSTLVCGTGSTFVRASASSWVCGTVTEIPVQSLALAAGAESRAEAASEEASGLMRMPSKAPFEARRMEISGILCFFMIFLLSVFKNSLRVGRRKMRGATKNIIPHPDGFCNPGPKKNQKTVSQPTVHPADTSQRKKLCKIAEKRNFVIDNREKIWYNGLRNEQAECHWNQDA